MHYWWSTQQGLMHTAEECKYSPTIHLPVSAYALSTSKCHRLEAKIYKGGKKTPQSCQLLFSPYFSSFKSRGLTINLAGPLLLGPHIR